jgi:hypothetical protein
MPQLPEDFLLWTTLATIAALLLCVLLALMRSLMQLGKWNEKMVIADPRFPDREPLSLDEFYEEYYASHKFPRAIVLDVLTRFASAVRVPTAMLRPEDTFNSFHHAAENVGETVTPDRDACEHLAVETASAIREAEHRYGANLFSGQLNTLDDYIRTTVLAHRLMKGN